MAALQAGNTPLAVDKLEQVQRLNGHHAGALLDLAELYCKQGNSRKGVELLDGLESRFNPPLEILSVIEQIRQNSCVTPVTGSKWALGVAWGHDSNVNQGISEKTLSLGSDSGLSTFLLGDEFQPKPSSFFGVSGYYARAIDGKSNLYGTFSSRDYGDARSFNMLTLSVGHEREFSGNNWLMVSDVNMAFRTLGGNLYQQTLSGQAKWLPRTGYWQNLPLGVDMTLQLSHYPARPAFDSLETTLLLPTAWQIADSLSTRLAAGWLIDHALNDRPGGDRSGPTFRAEAIYSLAAPGLKSYIGWQKRLLKGESSYAPPLLSMVRKQNQQLGYLAVEKNLGDIHSLRLEYQQLNNQDTVPIYQSKSHSLILSWVMQSTY